MRKESVREREPTFSSSADDYYHNPHRERPARTGRGRRGRGGDYLFTQHGSCRSFVTPPSGVRIFPVAFQRHHTEVENKASEEETSRGSRRSREKPRGLLGWCVESAEFRWNAIFHPSDAPGAPARRRFIHSWTVWRRLSPQIRFQSGSSKRAMEKPAEGRKENRGGQALKSPSMDEQWRERSWLLARLVCLQV